MTKQELIELLADIPDHAEVAFKAEIEVYYESGRVELDLQFQSVTHPKDSKEKCTIWLEE